MAVEVGRSLSGLTQKAKEYNSEIRKSKQETRALDKALKLNPGNVDLVKQKYAALSNQLTLNRSKLDTLKQKQNQLNVELKAGTITQQTYEKELIKVRNGQKAAETAIAECTEAMRRQNSEIRNAKFNSLISGLDKAQQKTEKLSKGALALGAGLVMITKSAISAGDALDDNATKYSTTAEQLQIQRNRYSKLTADSETYINALARIGSMQSSIAAGRGQRYITYLKQLGISQADLANKTNAEIFDIIYEKLRTVTDATSRATIAQGLFGDSGLNVATVAGTAQEAIDALDKTLIENGIITSEQAMFAGQAQDRLDSLKYQYQAVSAEVLVSLLPAFNALCDFLRDTAIPWVSKLSDWFKSLGETGQKAFMVLLFGLIILPKLIGFIKTVVTTMHTLKAATLAQAGAMGTLTAASGPWIAILMAIAAALMLVISLINMFIGKSKSAVDVSSELMDSLAETEQTLNDMGYTTSYSAEKTYNDNTHKSLDVNVNVEASGDTRESQQYADEVGETIYGNIREDLINQALGLKVR